MLIRPASILTIVLWLSPFEGFIPILFMPSPEEILLCRVPMPIERQKSKFMNRSSSESPQTGNEMKYCQSPRNVNSRGTTGMLPSKTGRWSKIKNLLVSALWSFNHHGRLFPINWVDRVTPLVLLIRSLSSTHGYRRHTLRPGGREGCMWGRLLPIHQRRVRLSNMMRRKSDWYQKKAIVNLDLFFGLFSCALESYSHIRKERATRHRVGLLR